jgi:hypothetical protein
VHHHRHLQVVPAVRSPVVELVGSLVVPSRDLVVGRVDSLLVRPSRFQLRVDLEEELEGLHRSHRLRQRISLGSSLVDGVRLVGWEVGWEVVVVVISWIRLMMI